MYRKKVVCLPIVVPEEDWCVNWTKGIICGYYDSLNFPECTLRIDYDLQYDENGNVPKPLKCRQLKEYTA